MGFACALLSHAALAQTSGLANEDLASALLKLARQNRIELLFDQALVAGRRTPVVGPFRTVGEALDQLLKGTGLGYRREGSVYVIAPARPPAAGPGEAAADVQELVVTGFRNSLAHARDIQRLAIVSTDVILAEDISAFPDLNLAESLQRVPGIAISRDSGEGRQITLRGLDPDLTRTQLNGMEVLGNTASGMDNRGAVSRTRSFDYSLFASELFNKVVVQKSYAADLDEGGIGGTVQLETAKPFDYPGFEVVLSAKAAINSNAPTLTPRLVGLVADRWGDFGALVSVAYGIQDSNEFGYRNFSWVKIHIDPANIGPGVSAADAARLTATGDAEVFAPQADTYSTWYDRRSRLGATMALQYQPSQRLKLSFDALYSELQDSRSDYALAASGTNSLTGDVTGTQVLQSDVIEGGSLVQASYTGVDLRSEANVEEDSTRFFQVGLRGRYEASDRLSFNLAVGYSSSAFALPVFDKVFLESQDHAFSFDDRPAMPVNTYGFDTTDPEQWNLMRMDTEEVYIRSQYTSGKLDGVFTLDAASALKAGSSTRYSSTTAVITVTRSSTTHQWTRRCQRP